MDVENLFRTGLSGRRQLRMLQRGWIQNRRFYLVFTVVASEPHLLKVQQKHLLRVLSQPGALITFLSEILTGLEINHPILNLYKEVFIQGSELISLGPKLKELNCLIQTLLALRTHIIKNCLTSVLLKHLGYLHTHCSTAQCFGQRCGWQSQVSAIGHQSNTVNRTRRLSGPFHTQTPHRCTSLPAFGAVPDLARMQNVYTYSSFCVLLCYALDAPLSCTSDCLCVLKYVYTPQGWTFIKQIYELTILRLLSLGSSRRPGREWALGWDERLFASGGRGDGLSVWLRSVLE